MRPYVCICADPHDAAAAQRIRAVTARYGLCALPVPDDLPRGERTALLTGCRCALAVTSEDAENGCLGTDVRLLLSAGIPVVCISLGDNALDRRLCVPVDPDGEPPLHAAELFPCPDCFKPSAGENADPDVLTVHRLLVRRLCRYADCFASDDPQDDPVSLAAAAWAGDAAAAFSLAGLYESGTGLPPLQSEAVRWTETAAAGRHPDAMLRLAAYRLDGIGGVKAPAEALSLYRQVGGARGLYGQGLCAEFGFGMLSDPGEAIRLYRLAIEAAGGTYPEAQLRLGLVEAGLSPDAFRSAAFDLRQAALSVPDGTDTDMPLYLRRPVSRRGSAEGGQRPAFRLVSLRSMAEKTLIPLLGSRGVFPQDSRAVMRACRFRRTAYPEAAWLPIPVSGDADTADVDLYGHFSDMRFDASMPAYALGSLLEQAHRRSFTDPADTAGRRVSGADALRWYRFAAGRGHSAAMRRLGDCYRQGFGVPRDPEQAVRLYEKAAELDDADSRFVLGVCLELGEGIAQDGAAAAAWYEKAAKAGHAPAMNNLGGCCERGFGVERDLQTAVDWYTKAAKLGQPEAAYRLGRCAEAGRGTRRDTARAAELYRQSAEAGNPYAVYRLGLFADHGLLSEPRVTGGTRLYEQAARAGVPEAAYAMGLCARGGRGTRREPSAAFYWFSVGAGREPASSGRSAVGAGRRTPHVQSTFETACCLFDGEGTIRNRREAVALFGEAVRLWEDQRAAAPDASDDELVPPDGLTADEAAAEAMFRLGYCTLYGIGMPEADLAASTVWLTRSSELGHAGARTLMGDLYAWGLLTTPDDAPAVTAAPAAPAQDAGERPLCCPSELYPNPWKDAGCCRGEAVKWYRLAAECDRLSGQTCREGRADALMSLALERSVEADRLFAAGQPQKAREADAACFGYLGRAADMDESRDEALLLSAASVYGGRDGRQTDADTAPVTGPAPGSAKAAAAYLQGIRRHSPAYAAAETASGDFSLYAQQTGPGMTLNASPYVQTAAHYLRALNKFHIVGADNSLMERINAGTETAEQADTAAEGHRSGHDPALEAQRFASDRLFCLRERAACRRAMTEQVRREALYRMAILCASHLRTERIPEPNSDAARLGHKVCFAYLAEAILCGHPQARDDLARMLAAPPTAPEQPMLRRLRLFGTAGNGADAAGTVGPSVLMKEYYANDRRLTVPFRPGVVSPPGASQDDPSGQEVTPAMQAAAMNYLGDCLYYGQNLTMDKASAVTCFREAADTNLTDCPAVTWAQYSLGCCLVKGIGTQADPREGVGYLTVAAKTHGAAAYTLASCYENGLGVDPGDYRYREAVKYYRRALALGYEPAEEKLKAMES